MIHAQPLLAACICLAFWLSGVSRVCAQAAFDAEPARGAAEQLFERAAHFAESAARATAASEPLAAHGALRELALLLPEVSRALAIQASSERVLRAFEPRSSAPADALRKAAAAFERGRAATAANTLPRARAALEDAHDALDSARAHDAWITDSAAVLAVLLATLAILLWLGQQSFTRRVFAILPLIARAYFLPTLLSNTGLLPREAPLYRGIKELVLPACLVLLILCADLRATARLGKPALIMFLSGTFGIVLGGVIAYAALGWMLPADLGDEAWKGLAALSGSWVGGAANFLAIGTALDVAPSTLSRLVIVDVVVSYLWMAILLALIGRERAIDARSGADRRALDEVRRRVENAPESRPRPAETRDLLALAAIALGITVLARAIAPALPAFGGTFGSSTWTIVLVTGAAIGLSFTKVRRLEAAGASRLGTALLYLLVSCIGVGASFASFFEAPALLALGFFWMGIHALVLWLVWRRIKAPFFFAAVGSMANVGGPASAPVVAAASHPALAPVGALLAVLGLVIGTYTGLLLGHILSLMHG